MDSRILLKVQSLPYATLASAYVYEFIRITYQVTDAQVSISSPIPKESQILLLLCILPRLRHIAQCNPAKASCFLQGKPIN